MRPPLFVRQLTTTERQQAQAGLWSREAFSARRCQILLASAARLRPAQIARNLGRSTGTVRNRAWPASRRSPPGLIALAPSWPSGSPSR